MVRIEGVSRDNFGCSILMKWGLKVDENLTITGVKKYHNMDGIIEALKKFLLMIFKKFCQGYSMKVKEI